MRRDAKDGEEQGGLGLSVAQEPGLSNRSPSSVSLRRQAQVGAAWTTLLTLASRVQQTVLQLVLAWLLSPGDFGLIAMAYTVMAYAWFLQHAGVGAVLIQRQKRFHLWVSPAAALVTLTGALATLLALAAAWPAAQVYDQPRLAGVIALLAAGVLPDALRSVANAKLRADLRFKTYTQLQLVGLGLVFVLTLVLAASGFGVYSFVIPRVAASVVMLGIEWAVSRPGVRPGRLWRRWRFLVSSSAWVTLAGLCIQVMNQGDYTVLGLLVGDKDTVGHYFFAFMLSTQAMMLVTINIGGVLTPVFARLQDQPEAQADRFFEACRIVALAGVPACFGLALVADPLIRVCFDERYISAIPYLQILSIAMAFRMVAHNGNFLIQANGHWRSYFLLSLTNALVFVGACVAGGWWAGPIGLTVGVSVFYGIFGFTQLWVATRGLTRRRAGRIVELYAVPAAVCLPVYAALVLLQVLLSPPPWLGLLGGVGLGAGGSLLTLRWLFPTRLEHFLNQVPAAQKLRRWRGQPGRSPRAGGGAWT